MIDYKDMKLYQLLWYTNKPKEIDVYVADKINISYLFYNYWRLSRINYSDMPKTANRINELLLAEFDNDVLDISEWWKLKFFTDNLVVREVKLKLLELWINNKIKSPPRWVYSGIQPDSNLHIKILEKLIIEYKACKSKSKEKISSISFVFNNIKAEELDYACELMSKSTPAIAGCILSREDISDKYMLFGLKALSKLKRQKDIKFKIDFKSLETLGSRGRLNAIRHLIGIMSKWRGSIFEKESLPFKRIPTKEEMALFLFPCSFKYNNEVSDLLKRYDDIINPIVVKKPASKQ